MSEPDDARPNERAVGPFMVRAVPSTLSQDPREVAGAVQVAQQLQQLHRNALPAVRAKAVAWRNGLAGLLAGLVGFGLVKGHSDVSTLAWPANVLAGGCLLAALVAGGYGAHQLLLAAHGRPTRVATRDVRLALGADFAEAEWSAKATRRGTVSTLACVALLVSAVGITWYAPTRDSAQVEIHTPAGTVCGTVVRLRADILTVRTAAGEQEVMLADATGLRAVATCA